RQPHHLPGVAIDRHLAGSRNTALDVGADDFRWLRRRQELSRKELLGADFGIFWIVERRQRLSVETAPVLRERRAYSDGHDHKWNQNRHELHGGTLCAQHLVIKGAARTLLLCSGFSLVPMIGQRQRDAVPKRRLRQLFRRVEQDRAIGAIAEFRIELAERFDQVALTVKKHGV